MDKFIPVEPEKWAEMVKAQAEVERLKVIILAQSSDFVRSKTADDGIKPEGHNDLAGRAVERCLELQAEVERLTSDLQMEKENEDRLVRLHQKANNEVYGLQSQVAALIDDQTRLKAEVERSRDQYNGIIDTQLKVIEELKAEVEQSKRINTELLVLSERQASDIRRLTKAGDAMLSEWSSGDEKDANNFRKALVIWHAAKQGGQP